MALVMLIAACSDVTATGVPIGPGTTTPPGSTPTIEVVTPSAPLEGLTATLLVSDQKPLIQAISPVGDHRIFMLEKAGRILVWQDDEILSEPFLDIEGDVLSEGNEQGLLSLAFHPRFHENGRVFVTYTDLKGDLQLIEYRVSPDDPNRLAPESRQPILEVPQPHQYHQSGSVVFGPDGYLWMSVGDGGGSQAREENPQDPGTLQSSIVRLDIDAAVPYAIPPDNPFVQADSETALPEVWAYGLRNPWRITIDPLSGLLYLPDVGQETHEEINVVPLDDSGLNFGWPITEGSQCFEADTCETTGLELPVFEFEHQGACAIVGGPVYLGAAMPELHGTYFFADFCVGWIRSFTYSMSEGVADVVDWEGDLGRLGNITSLSTDGQGEILVSNLNGEVWRIDPVR